MDTWLMHPSGVEVHVFSAPFQFDRQVFYAQNPAVVVNQGDQIHSVCTFQNPTSNTVVFGQSTAQEMCFQFTVSYPVGSLDNGISLTGATNACLSPNVLLTHSN